MLRDYFDVSIKVREQMQGPPEGYKYSCIEEYVKTNGRAYPLTRIPDDTRDWLKGILPEPMEIKQCFANSQEIVLSTFSRRLVYVEGYCHSGLIPVLHGWVEVDGRHVLDPTLRPVDAGGGWDGDREYFGVRFPDTEAIRLRVIENAEYSSMLDDWRNHFPLLKEERRCQATTTTTSATGK